MRDIKRSVRRQPLKLVRDAQGRLRSSVEDRDIADIWAEQRRIKLAEAIQEDKRKIEKKKQRQQRWSNLKSGRARAGLPKPKFFKWVAAVRKWEKRRLIVTGSAVGLVVAVISMGVVTQLIFGKSQNKTSQQKQSGNGVLGTQKAAKPDYETILPKGKDISDLGGWAKVSPPGKAPVYAYVDTVEGTQLNVSEQPLPESFKKDPAGETAKLATQFTANQKLLAGDTTFYVGTSIKGPQSVVFTTDGLLVLIKSASKLTDQQWMDYVASLD